MKRSNRKGFTTVELVIVIAVIAILAAVLIPTFVSLINKANLSADQQAVRNMNTILKQEEAAGNKPQNGDEAVAILLKNNFADFNTYSANCFLAWLAENNIVVLVEAIDGAETVLYPKEGEGKTGYERINPAAMSVEDLLNLLQDASGNTVFLGENVEASSASDFYFKDNGEFSLNLGGKTVYTNVPNTTKGYQDGIVVDGSAQTTIADGSIEGGDNVQQVLAVYDQAKLEVNNAVVSGGTQIGILAEAGGSATVNDTKILGAAGTNPLQAYGGTLVLNNVTAAQSGNAAEAWYNSVIQVASEITYVNGAWQTTGNKAYVTVNSGNYSGKVAVQINSPGGYVTINGGTFTGTGNVIVAGMAQNYYDEGYRCEVTINGGTFNGTIQVDPLAELVINGGTFTDNPSQWVGAGHSVVANADGTWTVK